MKHRSWGKKIKANKKNVESNITHTESINEDALMNRNFEIRQLEKVIGATDHLHT